MYPHCKGVYLVEDFQSLCMHLTTHRKDTDINRAAWTTHLVDWDVNWAVLFAGVLLYDHLTSEGDAIDLVPHFT